MNDELIYPAIFTKEEDGFTVTFPDVPLAVTEGDTVKEAFIYAQEALEGALEIMDEQGLDLPNPSDVTDLTGDYVLLVPADMIAYRKRNSKVVRRNVTVPDYLDALAKRHGDNVSEILSKALEERYVIK
jgi:predicted RNase H-like HicB family nuclease